MKDRSALSKINADRPSGYPVFTQQDVDSSQ